MNDKDLLLSLYKSMLRVRLFEERISELYPEGEIRCPVHLCTGQEAVAAGACAALKKEDYVFSNHRGHGHYLAKGGSMNALMAEIYGKDPGCSSGKGGSMHITDIEYGIPVTSAIVGGGIPLGVGAALASSIKGDGRVSMIFFGDGAFEEGVFHESVNFASLKRLPVVFVCENNLYATNSHISRRQSGRSIAAFASPYSAQSASIDGNDVIAVYNTALNAVKTARGGGGPALIEAHTYRWKGHVGPGCDFEKGDRTEAELKEWTKRCPIERLKNTIIGEGAASNGELAVMEAAVKEEVEASVRFAKEAPYPSPDELLTDVYAGGAL